MDNTIRYLNTDLDLVCSDDPTALANRFQVAGVYPLSVSKEADHLWYARFETDAQHDEPESNIAEILVIVESLEGELRSLWERCILREFSVGYDCGTKPWAFQHALSATLIARIAAAHASLRITLYPDRDSTVDAAQESS